MRIATGENYRIEEISDEEFNPLSYDSFIDCVVIFIGDGQTVALVTAG